MCITIFNFICSMDVINLTVLNVSLCFLIGLLFQLNEVSLPLKNIDVINIYTEKKISCLILCVAPQR